MSSSSSGYSSYSPISTLERQNAKTQRIFLFVQGHDCCVKGGIETVLKFNHGGASSTATTVPQQPDTNNDDPFSFLNNDVPPQTTVQPGKKKFKQKVMQSLKKTSKQLERMAIRTSTKSDFYVLGLYTLQHELLCMTDSVHPNAQLNFVIPLVLNSSSDAFLLKLWIRSGSTLHNKNYLVGSCNVSKQYLQSILQQFGGTHGFTTLQLQSPHVVGAHLKCCLAAELKYPVPCGLGWSLTDPTVSNNNNNGIHNVPLDASYGYVAEDHENWLVATERTIESTVVLPLATAYAALLKDAATISLEHAASLDNVLLSNRHDSNQGRNATVDLGIGHLQLVVNQSTAVTAWLTVSWQRPDCIFEVELLAPQKLPVHTSSMVEFCRCVSVPLYAKVLSKDDPTILPSLRHGSPLGRLRFQLRIVHGARPENQVQTEDEWMGYMDVEPSLQKQQVSISMSKSQEQMGHLVMEVAVTLDDLATQPAVPSSAQGGLVSLVGLDTLLEESGALPILDYDLIPSPSSPTSNDPTRALRKAQLQTMGNFVTHAHLQRHLQQVRRPDVLLLQERHSQYSLGLAGKLHDPNITSWQDKSPKPFRPSSSRMQEELAGIGFNVHIQSLSLQVLNQAFRIPQSSALFTNVTCGAPADHARHFGNYLGTKTEEKTAVGTISGGLRRLETKRLELAKALEEAQSDLIAAVGQHLSSTMTTHISARHSAIASKRWRVFEMTQHLTSLTWTCAVRRANCFSQALGIAVSSYLTSLADTSKRGWHDLWTRHGYLVTFEGLLSAAGKELGMIEDASVGIAMLRMVEIVLVCDVATTGTTTTTSTAGAKVAVPHSPYLRWVQMSYTGKGSGTRYRLEIGIDQLYYEQRIPEPLRNGASVRMYPLLYQVGVDIRQWGAHAKQNLGNRDDEGEQLGGGMIDDEDDDVGAVDNDVLIQLNMEACRKMNNYAHMISPSGSPQTIHPLMTSLHAQVMSSAGKMVHGIVDEAATITQRLGGGGVVFCKSGKDRTAMQVTYKQSQFINRFLLPNGNHQEGVFENASLMRVYGTRLPICEKNVGQALFAFNSLQVKFMPDMLKPPPSTLAGFLKGGRVFSREGAIES